MMIKIKVLYNGYRIAHAKSWQDWLSFQNFHFCRFYDLNITQPLKFIFKYRVRAMLWKANYWNYVRYVYL